MTSASSSLFPGAERFSITHHHLHGVIASTLARAQPADGAVRILDVGCGSGSLMEFLQTSLTQRFPEREIELHGFDVADSKVQKEDFFSVTLARLAASHATVDWSKRLAMISSEGEWPYPADHFDFVISNQVLEHVRSHARLFDNIARVIKPAGLSAHLFPLRDSWIEWHLKMPFAHWITNGDVLERWIHACSLLGLGTWRKYCREVERVPLAEFARMNRDFIVFETNYITEDDIRRLTKHAGLRYSFRFTDDLYFNRARLALGKPLDYDFGPRGALGARLRFMEYRRISTICLVLEKDNAYVNRGFHTPGH